ncbi:MAG: helix-turn-helix domain-containing protein [Candidatus Aenigmatarchaeota archaeon]
MARTLIYFVKALALASFFLALLLLFPTTFAQLQYYGIDAVVDEAGKTKVKLTFTFFQPETSFEFSLIGRIEKLSASSMGLPVDCSLSSGAISSVKCKLNLTQERRTIELNFETSDFVKVIGKNYIFDADFGLGKEIASVFVSVKLPEGFSLVGEDVKERLSFPESVTILSDGRRHIITWKFLNVSANQSLRFRIIYEKVKEDWISQILFYFGILIVAAIFASILIYFKFFRKPEKIILSVLDEFERKVMDAIVAAGGEVNQKKVVQATNLSKAKVSRVVKSLAERGLIEIERLGRTNKLKIVKKKFKLF